MKKTAKLSLLTIFLAVVTLTTILGLKFMSSRDVGWGHNDSALRPVYTEDQINDGVLGNNIVFNSITDGVIGDERNFVAARINDGNHGQENVWSANDIKAEHGEEYIIRLYYHNNSPKGENAIAHNTRVGIYIPQISSTEVQVNGHIYTDTGEYRDYYDYVNFKADVPFHLEYIKGSARIDNDGYGINGAQVSDNVVYNSKDGVKIGYFSDNGDVPGCYTYDGYVTVKVKVVYDTDYIMTHQVRLVGSTEWSNTVDAKIGDKVEFWIQYRNISSENQMNVMIRDVLPQSLRLVAGTTKLWNETLNGAVEDNNTIASTGINIGHYGPNANAHVRFQAEVVEDGLVNGKNVLGNWAQASAAGVNMQNATVVNVNKDE